MALLLYGLLLSQGKRIGCYKRMGPHRVLKRFLKAMVFSILRQLPIILHPMGLLNVLYTKGVEDECTKVSVPLVSRPREGGTAPIRAWL
jgi:hypothetical protein